MILSSKNQIANSRNQYQNDDKRVLCVCSAGLLRSPTVAEYLNKKFGYNTRACGTSSSFALIPISTALINWADEVVFVNRENFLEVNPDFLQGKVVKVLDLPDEFERNDPLLIKHIEAQYVL